MWNRGFSCSPRRRYKPWKQPRSARGTFKNAPSIPRLDSLVLSDQFWYCGLMNPRVFMDLDPRALHLPTTRTAGADPGKLQRQIARFGKSTQNMPPLEVYRGTDGKFMIYDGVTRATRVAKLLPGQLVRVELIDDLTTRVGHLPTVGDKLP